MNERYHQPTSVKVLNWLSSQTHRMGIGFANFRNRMQIIFGLAMAASRSESLEWEICISLSRNSSRSPLRDPNSNWENELPIYYQIIITITNRLIVQCNCDMASVASERTARHLTRLSAREPMSMHYTHFGYDYNERTAHRYAMNGIGNAIGKNLSFRFRIESIAHWRELIWIKIMEKFFIV